MSFKLDTSMTLSKRDKSLLCIAGIILVLIVGIMFCIMPLINSFQDSSKKLDTLRKEKLSTKSMIDSMADNQAKLDILLQSLPDKTGRYEAVMPSSEIDRYLYNLTEQYGLSTSDMTMTGYLPVSASLYAPQDTTTAYYPNNSQEQDANASSASSQTSNDQTATDYLNATSYSIAWSVVGDFSNVEKMCDYMESNLLGIKISSVSYDFSSDEHKAILTLNIYGIADVPTQDTAAAQDTTTETVETTTVAQ